MSSLPRPRGEVTERLFAALRKPPHAVDPVTTPVADEDLQLALYCCYELHYRGFEGVDDRWEWEPSLLALRARARAPVRGASCSNRGPPGEPPVPDARSMSLLRELMHADEAPSVSTLHRARSDGRAGPRVHDSPLGLSAQGGRSALVGASASVGQAEGGDGRGAGRRVRQRACRCHPRRAVRSRDGRRRARTRPTAPTSTRSRA